MIAAEYEAGVFFDAGPFFADITIFYQEKQLMECGSGDAKTKDGRMQRFILVVDGNPVDRFYSTMLLQRFSYNVCTAGSPKEAMEFIAVAAPALIVAAAGREGKDVLELIRLIKRFGGTADIPVIALSADLTSSFEKLLRAAGCPACLKKPVSAEELYRAVQKTMENTPRSNIRVTTYLRVEFEGGPAGGANYATVLSENGMFVLTQNTLQVGARLPLRLTVGDRVMGIVTIVLYSYGFGEGPLKEPGMGLKFERIAPEDRALIKSFILEKIYEGIPERKG